MSQNMLVTGYDYGFQNVKRVKAKSAASDSNELVDATVYASLATLDANLTAKNAAYYTAERLNKMSMNDKVYAARLANDPDSLK